MDIVVQNYIKNLDSIFDLANKVDKDEDKLRAHLARYLCIRVSGLMETFFKSQISRYLKGSTPKPVEKYVNSRFKHFTSINCNRIEEVLKMFSENWHQEFINTITEPMRNSLDSVIADRHSLAHGKELGITLKQMEIHYKNIQDVIALLELIISK